MLVEKLNALPKKLDFSITATQGSGNYMPHAYSRATTVMSIIILTLAGIDADHCICINLMITSRPKRVRNKRVRTPITSSKESQRKSQDTHHFLNLEI